MMNCILIAIAASVIGVGIAHAQMVLPGSRAHTDLPFGGCVYNSTPPGITSTLTTGTALPRQCNNKGSELIVIQDAAGNNRGANVNSSNQLSVSIDGSTASNISTNVAQIGGTTVSTGTGAQGAGAQRVTVATDTATIAGSAPGTAGSASTNVLTVQGVASMTPVQVSQATASSLNATIVGTGAAGTAATGVVTVQGIASMTKLLVTPDALPANQTVNLAQVGGTNTVNGGVAGSLAIGGTVLTNVAITANPINLGAQAISSENTVVTATRQVQLVADLTGKLITMPFANKENLVKGTTGAMTGTTSTVLLAAVASQKLYVTYISCVNSHASVGTFVTVQDGMGGTALTTLAANSGYGGDEQTGSTPLFWTTAGNGLYVADVTTGANVICNASGYSGV